ncbi:hypothetical protein [Streptomyces sp. NBC_00582]|uniref:hypothetical protein n=1 Tax=Streptomyces sp. NBC_00582 TaxID=2975783 RepID=UPI001062864C|nr:hypothetical protein [Streptomyces sp. NBC_00582]WUB65233.1 hypothetical protein OG852_34915 [Streptomyces sp. NBC_00582]
MSTITTGARGDGETAAVRLARGESVGAVLPGDDPGAWIALDAGVRQSVWYADDGVWLHPWAVTEGGRALLATVRRNRAGGLTAVLRRAQPLTASQLALALCHGDGRIRQTALDGVADHPGLLPLVVVRCSDWVPQVREAARRRLAEALDARTAVRLMPLVLRIGRRGRGDFATALADRLLRTAPPGLLAPLYSDPDRAVRRYAYRLAVEERLLSPLELARAATRDSDTVVQSLCADAALAAVTDDEAHDDVLDALLGARNPRVRAAGVTALRRAGRTERAVGFLADRAAVVRACARYVVRQGGSDPLPWYRERCADPRGLPPGAVIGLAECGERADAEVLWALLGHPAAGVRARAVAGLRTLDVTDVRRLRPLLDDPAPAVVREVTAALLPSAGAVSEEELTERLGHAWPRQVRVAALRLLDARGGIVRLRAAVTALDDPDERIRTWARQSVQGWHAGGDVPREAAAEVGGLLDRARHLFSAYALRQRKWEAGVPV